MKIVRNDRAKVDLDEFLRLPLMVHLSTYSPAGPRDTPLWYIWEDGSIWCITEVGYNTVHERIEKDSRVSAGFVDFDPKTGRLQHVSMRGTARVEPWNDDLANRLLHRYYIHREGFHGKPPREGQPSSGRLPMKFIRFDPESVRIREQSYTVEDLR